MLKVFFDRRMFREEDAAAIGPVCNNGTRYFGEIVAGICVRINELKEEIHILRQSLVEQGPKVRS